MFGTSLMGRSQTRWPEISESCYLSKPPVNVATLVKLTFPGLFDATISETRFRRNKKKRGYEKSVVCKKLTLRAVSVKAEEIN